MRPTAPGGTRAVVPPRAAPPAAGWPAAVRVVRPGLLTTVQDLGRRGVAHLGVPRGGALDVPACRLANRLAGNGPGAAVLETTVTGVAVRALAPVVAAVAGAPAPVAVDGRPAPWGEPVVVPAGAVLEVGTAACGVRSYVAFAGGVAVDPVLGSRSTHLLSGLGPPVPARGDVLPVGRAAGPPVRLPVVPLAAPPRELVLPLLLGPREDWLAPASLAALGRRCWTVAPASNRVALRTAGPPLARARQGELPSEGMVLGAVQVPPDGLPVVFLADHPTTGGYPVVGVVPEADLAAAAQAAPGTPVRFLPRRPD